MNELGREELREACDSSSIAQGAPSPRRQISNMCCSRHHEYHRCSIQRERSIEARYPSRCIATFLYNGREIAGPVSNDKIIAAIPSREKVPVDPGSTPSTLPCISKTTETVKLLHRTTQTSQLFHRRREQQRIQAMSPNGSPSISATTETVQPPHRTIGPPLLFDRSRERIEKLHRIDCAVPTPEPSDGAHGGEYDSTEMFESRTHTESRSLSRSPCCRKQ